GRITRSTHSDAGGAFEFESVPDGPAGAVLSAMREEYKAGLVVLGQVRNTWPAEVRVVLEPAPSMSVLVQDERGVPASDAVVQQFGLAPQSASKDDPLSVERAQRQLTQTLTTGGDGTVHVGPFPGEQVLVASRGNERSLPWRGHAQAKVVLTLHPTFE